MYQRLWHVTLLMVAVGCSQRAPWRVVPAPTPSSPSIPPSPAAIAAADATAVAHLHDMLFPVAGHDSTRLDDSFEAPRDGGARKHGAIDIMAPRGSAIVSVADGRILRMAKNEKGGITVFATDLEDQFVYYYAHLDRYHHGLYNGKPLMRGDTLGYVGTTGNAPKDLPHLHFQVMRMPSDKKNFWNGEPINPYPLLRQIASTSANGK